MLIEYKFRGNVYLNAAVQECYGYHLQRAGVDIQAAEKLGNCLIFLGDSRNNGVLIHDLYRLACSQKKIISVFPGDKLCGAVGEEYVRG